MSQESVLSETQVAAEYRKDYRKAFLKQVGVIIVAALLGGLAVSFLFLQDRADRMVFTQNEVGVILNQNTGKIVGIFENNGSSPRLADNEEVIYTTTPNWRSIPDSDPNDEFFNFRSESESHSELQRIRNEIDVDGELVPSEFTVSLNLDDTDMVTQYYNQLIDEGHTYELSADLSPFTVVFDDAFSKLTSVEENVLPSVLIKPGVPVVVSDESVAELYVAGFSAIDAQNLLILDGKEPAGIGAPNVKYYSDVVAEYSFLCEKPSLVVMNDDHYRTALAELIGVPSYSIKTDLSYPGIWTETTQPCGINFVSAEDATIKVVYDARTGKYIVED